MIGKLTLYHYRAFPSGSVMKNQSACQVGDMSSIPELERLLGEGNGNPLQYPCLGSSLDRGSSPWGHNFGT